MDAVNLLTILSAFFIVTISPGPANIAVATVAMSSGRRQALLLGSGLGVGLGFWGLIAATGIGAILQTSEAILTALKVFGGLYLVWLAIQSGYSALAPSKTPAKVGPRGRWFVRGLVLNLSNPKAVVAWMAALSVGLGSGDAGSQLVVAVLLCAAIGFFNYFIHALAFSLSGFMSAYKRLHRWIDGAVAGLFAATGIGLVTSAVYR